MLSDVRCDYCAINLTGMTVDEGQRRFCCDGHRVKYFARLSGRAPRLERPHVPAQLTLCNVLQDIQAFF